MALRPGIVRKSDIQNADINRAAVGRGVKMVVTRVRRLKVNFWRGDLEVSDSTTTVEKEALDDWR